MTHRECVVKSLNKAMENVPTETLEFLIFYLSDFVEKRSDADSE